MQGAAQSALEAIATAIYAALNGAAAFTALSPILNAVPQGTAKPSRYLRTSPRRRGTRCTSPGKSCTFQLHTVTEDGTQTGDLQGFRIQSAARGVLDYQKFAVTNHTMVQCKWENADHWKEELVAGVVVRHFISIYRVDVAQTA